MSYAATFLPPSHVQATGKRFSMDASFTLGDLLKLGLHQCVDACTEIVDRAQKELLVEKARGCSAQWGRVGRAFAAGPCCPERCRLACCTSVPAGFPSPTCPHPPTHPPLPAAPQALHKVEETWRSMSLSFAPYQGTEVSQMTIDDAVIEALESDNLTLQTLSGGKYVQVRGPGWAQLGHGAPAGLALDCLWQGQLGLERCTATRQPHTAHAVPTSAPLPPLPRPTGQPQVPGGGGVLAEEAGHR